MDGRDALSCHSNGYNIISCLSEKRPHVILYYLILSLLFETTRRTFFLDLYHQPGSCRASTLIRLTVKFNCWSALPEQPLAGCWPRVDHREEFGDLRWRGIVNKRTHYTKSITRHRTEICKTAPQHHTSSSPHDEDKRAHEHDPPKLLLLSPRCFDPAA